MQKKIDIRFLSCSHHCLRTKRSEERGTRHFLPVLRLSHYFMWIKRLEEKAWAGNMKDRDRVIRTWEEEFSGTCSAFTTPGTHLVLPQLHMLWPCIRKWNLFFSRMPKEFAHKAGITKQLIYNLSFNLLSQVTLFRKHPAFTLRPHVVFPGSEVSSRSGHCFQN